VPDLITLLLPDRAAREVTQGTQETSPPVRSTVELGAGAPGDVLYRFAAPELKAVNHRLDGVLWPRQIERGTAEQPVVTLEVQMQSKPDFHHRLAAQSLRFLQQHPDVEHLSVVVIVPHRRLVLGPAQPPAPLRAFLDEVIWLSLEELIQQPSLDPLQNLLTLPIRPEADLAQSSQQILGRRPDLITAVVPMLMERFPKLSTEEIMVIAGIPTAQLRHTRAAQELLEEGRLEGRQEGLEEGRQEGLALGEASANLRLLNRLYGPLTPATTDQLKALPLKQLQDLTDALLGFTAPQDLVDWLAAHTKP
jgi:predicted transposase YdaD